MKPFKVNGRERKLYRPTNGTWWVRFKHNGRDIRRSLDTTDEQVARAKATQLILSILQGDEQIARAMKVRSDYSLLQPICELFIHKFSDGAVRKGARWVGGSYRRMVTATRYVAELAKIVRTVTGQSLDEARASVLTGELIGKFEEIEEQRIAKARNGFNNAKSETSVRLTTGSTVRCARSIFARKNMHWFTEFALPDLTSFRERGVKSAEVPDPDPLDAGVIDAINAAAPELKRTNPAVYIAHLLFSRLGLRNSEIWKARKSWIVPAPHLAHKGTVAFLHIKARPDEGFKPKGSSGKVPIGPVAMAEINELWTASSDGDFLIPARSMTNRRDIVYEEHGAWVGQWIKDHTKVSYELRRYAGSLLYLKHKDIRLVQKFLRHADIKTTLRWYHYLLDDIPALDAADFVPAVEEPAKIVAFAR